MNVKDMEFDPVDYYRLSLKDAIRKNAEDYFDGLTKKAKVDVEKNVRSATELEKAMQVDKANENRLSRYRFLKTFLIVLIVGGVLAAAMGIYLLTGEGGLGAILALVIGLIVTILALLLLFLVVQPKIKAFTEMDAENNKKVAKLKAECLSELYPLHMAMSDRDFNHIVEKTTSAFHLDDSLKPEKLLMLRKLYGYCQDPMKNESVFTCLSGDVSTNPFLRLRLFTCKVRDKVYTGTRVISWTEVVGSGKNSHVVTRTQTLTAHVTKPAPFYNYATFVVYGNQAAPDLTFHRTPSGLKPDHDEKDVERLVKDREKELERKNEESIKKSGSFQPLANTDFEALFGAFDRDNEVQYRLLFTPLAQQNMTELITMKEPYGDDFSFYKLKKINIVSSRHGREIPDFQPDMFIGEVDIRKLKKTYVSTIASIFESLFFELAPVLCIPLYQQTDAGEYDPVQEVRHVSSYEAESFVNHMDGREFLHPEATTPQVLKVQFLESVGQSDVFAVDSASYKAIEQVAHISVFGGDGCSHDVPVIWYQYVPLKRTSSVAIRNYSGTKEDFTRLMAEKEYFQKEKEFYASAIRSKNFVGFRLKDGYNYSDEEDSLLDGLLRKDHEKGE